MLTHTIKITIRFPLRSYKNSQLNRIEITLGTFVINFVSFDRTSIRYITVLTILPGKKLDEMELDELDEWEDDEDEAVFAEIR